jgi:hypothetical protein
MEFSMQNTVIKKTHVEHSVMEVELKPVTFEVTWQKGAKMPFKKYTFDQKNQFKKVECYRATIDDDKQVLQDKTQKWQQGGFVNKCKAKFFLLEPLTVTTSVNVHVHDIMPSMSKVQNKFKDNSKTVKGFKDNDPKNPDGLTPMLDFTKPNNGK